ncbi:MAG TPA: TetR/AcrR family transcriptional regulator [Rhodanobacteraceae bacterium]
MNTKTPRQSGSGAGKGTVPVESAQQQVESAKPRKRRAGRPRGGDHDLRERLIDAAISQFTRTGVRATSLRAIATEAGATPAMLHYYFGSKQQMVEAVVEERLMPALAPMRRFLVVAEVDPATLVPGVVRGISELVARHAWLPPLWVREVLCEGGALRDALFERGVPQAPQVLARKFAAAQAAGHIDAAFDPRLLAVSLIGLTLFPAAGAPIWRRMLDAGDVDSVAMQAHALALFGQGIGVALKPMTDKGDGT